MKIISIPEEKYNDYRLDVIFNAYKHDPQYSDNNTIAKHILVLTNDEHSEIERLTLALDTETVRAEQLLKDNPKLQKNLKLPRQITKYLKLIENYDAGMHIRLNRYDFHPDKNGKWVVSEVNSDVPGGFAEASLLPQIAAGLFPDLTFRYVNFGQILLDEIEKKVMRGANIMLVHCTSYSDDRQVMQFLGDGLEERGYKTVYGASDHLKFINGQAYSILDGNNCMIDAVIRFTPLEWLVYVKPKKWHGYFNTHTVSCNHPISIFAQTKRFPFIWDVLEKASDTENLPLFSTWRQLLPETSKVHSVKENSDYIYKPVWGRVGERISIAEACRDDEYVKILRHVRRHRGQYISQKRFNSMPLVDKNGEHFHVCIGSFCVQGRAAGYYARVSKSPRIDSGAADIPVLIES